MTESSFPASEFRHEALFYSGESDFVGQTTAFIRDAEKAQEPVLAVLSARKIDLLRAALDRDAEGVFFEDMARVGRNPARIIPAWHRFNAEHGGPGRRIRGIGEPIWPERTAEELEECHRHEALLNLAFENSEGFWLLCPYDKEALEPAVVEEAYRTHPFVFDGGTQKESPLFPGLDVIAGPFAAPMRDPDGPVWEMAFTVNELKAVRGAVRQRAGGYGLAPDRIDDLELAISEVATNSVRHGGGEGTIRMWSNGSGAVCEVRDRGHITDPLLGRVRPGNQQEGGFGMWLVSQLCDLVQVRSFPTGSAVRLHVRNYQPRQQAV